MKIAVKILKTLLVVALVAGIVVMVLFGMSSGGTIDGDPVLEIGQIGKEPVYNDTDTIDYTDSVQALGLDAAITSGDKEEIKYSIFDLYRVGCKSWWNVPYRGSRYLGNGTGGIAGKVEGTMKTFNERYYVLADDAVNPYQYYGYEAKYNVILEANPSMLKGAVESSLAYARQYVYMPDGDWYWSGSQGGLNTAGGTGTFAASDLKYTSAADVKATRDANIAADNVRDYIGDPYDDPCGGDTPDKSTYIINPDVMLNDGLSLTSSTVDGKKVYTAAFTFDVSKNDYIKYANYFIGSTVSSITGIKYVKLTVKFEMWESGYFRSFSSVERWEGKHSLGTGFVELDSTELYTYDKTDVLTAIKDKVAPVQKADKSGKTMLSAKYNGVAIF